MRRLWRVLVVLATVAVLGAGCAAQAPPWVLEQTRRFETPIDLPAPDVVGSAPLESVLADRRSRRTFAAESIELDSIGQLFWAAQGITDAAGHRTAPSAGALYPLELYAITPTETIHYLPDGHRAERRDDPSALLDLAAAAFGQDWIGTAPLVLVVTGVTGRTEAKYGEAATAYVDREAGHAAQNLLLQATALGLEAVPVGGFEPTEVARILTLAPREEPRYLIPIGRPAN